MDHRLKKLNNAKHNFGKKTTPCSSNYSTCSSNNNLDFSRQSEIVSGQASVDQSLQSETLSETNFSINILDQNIDVISDNDVFMDCADNLSDNIVDSISCLPTESNDSTLYLPIGTLTKQFDDSEHGSKDNTISNDVHIKSINQLHLVTILEETETLSKENSLRSSKSNQNKLLEKMDNNSLKRKSCDQSHCDKKKLLQIEFSKRRNQLNLQGKNKSCFLKDDGKDKNQNTTESFLYWERICDESPENINFSKFRTLDDTELKNYDHLDTQKLRRRSKSCESLLEEVKHLPQVFHQKYDEFLKSLTNEIQEIRKKNINCTCKNNFGDKTGNLEIEMNSVSNSTNIKSPTVPRLSPNYLKKPSNIFRTPSPTKASPKKRQIYSTWRKEIKSPVGEYIKGKIPSPYKHSPNRI